MKQTSCFSAARRHVEHPLRQQFEQFQRGVILAAYIYIYILPRYYGTKLCMLYVSARCGVTGHLCQSDARCRGLRVVRMCLRAQAPRSHICSQHQIETNVLLLSGAQTFSHAVHKLVHSSTHLPMYSLNHSLISNIKSLMHSLPHLFIDSLSHAVHTLIHPSTHLPMYSFNNSLTRSVIPSFLHNTTHHCHYHYRYIIQHCHHNHADLNNPNQTHKASE